MLNRIRSIGRRSLASSRRILQAAGVIAVVAASTGAAAAETISCDGDLPSQDGRLGDQAAGGISQPDLLVDKLCLVKGTQYKFGKVNIVSGGQLVFIEPPVTEASPTQDFWANSIIIENGGALLAGVPYYPAGRDAKGEWTGASVPNPAYGSRGKTLRFRLYGSDPGPDKPAPSCYPQQDPANFADCGIPIKKWTDEGKTRFTDLPGGVTDYFYGYGALHGDDESQPNSGHFGNKSIGLSYGGILQLRGLKGTSGTSESDIAVMLKRVDDMTTADEPVITNSGTAWGRLEGFDKAAGTVTMDRTVKGDWNVGDEIVVTPTDYLPNHTEVRRITVISDDGKTVTVGQPFEFEHSSTRFQIASKVGGSSSFRTAVENVDGPNPAFLESAETRAAVGMLTRSIRVMSEGGTVNQTFAAMGATYSYGGHVVFRQGFHRLQIQGVEFAQLGQGGQIGRYPVHFHMARTVPADTYVIDSTVNESMTRWYVIHSTIGVTLARNIGLKSIGHGFYLEDATESENKLFSNLGVLARAGVQGPLNPRNIPGILVSPMDIVPRLKYRSDTDHPSVFWITNAWNSFAGNMAAGAGTCGACYWMVPAANHEMTHPGHPDMLMAQNWSGYSAIQGRTLGPPDSKTGVRPVSRDGAGQAPIKLFYKNSCSTAMHSLNVIDGSTCNPVIYGGVPAIPNPMAPQTGQSPDEVGESTASKVYYPRVVGGRHPTWCNPGAPAGQQPDACDVATCDNANPEQCMAMSISHYTTSFNWAEHNFSAVWLRGGFYLLDHLFLSDVQNGGVTIVTGGDYTRANLPIGYWGITSNSIFVGATQPDNPWAYAKGPTGCSNIASFCVYPESTIGLPLSNFATNQRLYNIYDGPAYQDANAYIDILVSKCNSLDECIYYNTAGVRLSASSTGEISVGDGYLPHGAIAWKQSNGFYYPPAFRSRNLLFSNVDIRHYVVEPLTSPGTYRTKLETAQKQYRGGGVNEAMFRNFTDVDRQTELTDDDGTLTGLDSTDISRTTISVNEDKFFAAPVQAAQCKSNLNVDPKYACEAAAKTAPIVPTARTSPYDHITTVVYPACADASHPIPAKETTPCVDYRWDATCSNETCFGVPIYRQFLTGSPSAATREWGEWMTNQCDTKLQALKDKKPVAIPSECRFPFVRMAGMGAWQRSVLTVNHGKYFIDTSISANAQKTSDMYDPTTVDRNINVFGPGQTYYVFFVFAKETTKQVYQIYVGPNFSLDQVKGITVNVNGFPLQTPKVWKDPIQKYWTVTRNADNPDVIEVAVDFKKVQGQVLNTEKIELNPAASADTCKPTSFCTNAGGTCGCDETKLGPLGKLYPGLKTVCANTCKYWAVRDLDCPTGGCLGFSFTLPAGFNDKWDTYVRPKPEQYPAEPWDSIKFVATKTQPDASSGDCFYSAANIPNDAGACKVADTIEPPKE